jgi:hypothetical protein
MPNEFRRLNLRPFPGECGKCCSGLSLGSNRKDSLSVASRHGGNTFHPRRPPNHDILICPGHVLDHLRHWLFQTQWNDCGRVPKSHRPPSRSSSRARKTRPWESLAFGIAQKSFGSLPEPSLINPRFSILPIASLPLIALAIGNNRATGFPRSVTRTSSPAFTRFRYSLKRAFSSDTAAVFISAPDINILRLL